MAQSNEITTTGATYVGPESTFNAASGSMVRVFPRKGGRREEEQTVLRPEGLRAHIESREGSVLGYKSCSSSMPFDARVHATQIDAAATPTRTWLGELLFAALGGESLHAGSTIAASSTTTVLKVASGHGSRFKVGDVIMVDVGGTPEFAHVQAISTDDLTIQPALSASPTTGQDVFACATYFPSETSTASLTFEHARAQNSASQWRHTGCVVSGMGVELARNALLGLTFDLAGVRWTGPSSLSISTAEGSQTMSAPFANVHATQILCPLGSPVRTQTPMESLSVQLTTGMMNVESVGGADEGRVGPMRTTFGMSADIVLRHDAAMRSGWDPATPYMLAHIVYSGTGATRRATGFIAIGSLEELPTYGSGSNDRGITNLKFASWGGRLNSGVSTEQARASFFWFMG